MNKWALENNESKACKWGVKVIYGKVFNLILYQNQNQNKKYSKFKYYACVERESKNFLLLTYCKILSINGLISFNPSRFVCTCHNYRL